MQFLQFEVEMEQKVKLLISRTSIKMKNVIYFVKMSAMSKFLSMHSLYILNNFSPYFRHNIPLYKVYIIPILLIPIGYLFLTHFPSKIPNCNFKFEVNFSKNLYILRMDEFK